MSRKIIVGVAMLLLLGVMMVQPAAAQNAVWVAQYYNNGTLSGDPTVQRNESGINFNWGQGSPAAGVSVDSFSARFVSDVIFPAGTYRFFMLADDQARVTINFNPIPLINTLGQSRVGQTITADVQLNGPTHVQIDYVELTGDAYLYLSWANLASNPNPQPGFGAPVTVPINTGSWTVQYYSNANLAGDPAAILTENNPSRDWGSGSPLASVPADNWSARWSSTQNLQAGQYQISVRADDGVRVFVNGALVINQWSAATGQTLTANLNLSQGNNNFTIEFLELGGVAFLDYRLIQNTPTVATPVPSQPTGGATMTVTGAFRLNVRSAPDSINGAILTRINRNESYPITGRSQDGGWWQINVNGTVGWVSARFVTAQNTSAVPVVSANAPSSGQGGGSTVSGSITVTASPYTVNMRQGPGTQFGRIARIVAGQTAALVGRNANNTWYQVNYNGIVGWVTAQYVVLSPGANINSIPVTG